MRRLTSREQRVFVVCLLTISIYVGYNGFVKPFHERLSALDRQIAAARLEIQKNQRTVRKAEILEKAYEENLAQYKQTGSSEQVMSGILSEIEESARELNLQISNLKPKRVKNEQYFNQFSVSLTIDSELVDIVHFLYLLQQSPHFFDIEEVHFDKGARRSSSAMKTELVLGKRFIP